MHDGRLSSAEQDSSGNLELDRSTSASASSASHSTQAARFCWLHRWLRIEDFQLLSRMQQNFAANADIEVVVGRHEPCLADRHRYYAAAVEGRY